jgi:hypothetical protein
MVPGPGMSRSRLILTTVVFWLVFLGAEATARLGSLYLTHPPIDLIVHFLSGAALASTWILIVRWRKRRAASRLRLRAVALLGTLAVSLLWEIGEMVEERIRVNPPHLLDPFFWDGVTDVLVAGLAAGMIGWLLSRNADGRA